MTLALRITSCVYCGHPAEGRDHFVPLSRERKDDDNFELPACNSCNATANSKFFSSFDEKATWIQRQKMRRGPLHEPNWTILKLSAPLVTLVLRLRAVGKNSALQNAAMKTSCCDICGVSLSQWQIKNSLERNRPTCSYKCEQLKRNDNNRKR